MEQNTAKVEKIYFYFFINTKSGGNLGKKYLTVKNHKINYEYGKSQLLILHFIDLFCKQELTNGLVSLEKSICKIQKRKMGRVHVIICGGDGTVQWVISLVAKKSIDLDKVIFCIIPIGTGNDFSRSIGWGGSPINFTSDKTTQLKQRVLQWMNAKETWFDIWHAKISTYDDGSIIHIRDCQEVDTGQTVMERGFCNYLGIGIDARISYSVQKHRQKNKWLNLGLYGCIGLCKLFKRIRPTHEAIHQFVEVTQDTEKHEALLRENTSKIQPLLTVKQEGKIQLKEGYGNLLALNSATYMAGIHNVWNTSKLGVIIDEPPSFTEQRHDDGKLEFLAFKNQLNLALERVSNFGTRVTQGGGPFTIKFNRTAGNDSTYLHIDGEGLKFRQLKQLIIQKSKLAPLGRIRVLVKDEN